MGRSRVSGLTLPRCQRLSSSTRCLTATWALAWRCCILQPPQAPACNPKWGQPGWTRWEDSLCIAVTVACSQLFFLRLTVALTCSNGNAPSTKTTLPSARWAIPWASMSRDSMLRTSWAATGAVSLDSVMTRLSQSSVSLRLRPGLQVDLPVRLLGCPDGEAIAHMTNLLRVLARQQPATHLLKAAIEQVGVH